jgi:hypothetical protein
MRILFVPIILTLLVSCMTHKLNVRLNGVPTQSMEARLDKENGYKTVDLLLPGGWWTVSASESGISPRIVKIEGRQHVRFELPPDRMLSVKPVELTLQGLDVAGKPSGTPFTVTIDYYTRSQKASPFS